MTFRVDFCELDVRWYEFLVLFCHQRHALLFSFGSFDSFMVFSLIPRWRYLRSGTANWLVTRIDCNRIEMTPIVGKDWGNGAGVMGENRPGNDVGVEEYGIFR